MTINNVGSVCSGIEAASVSWSSLGWKFSWFSEIADFPSAVLKFHYPNINNIGDMGMIPQKINNGEIESPDLICGGTPCQAFSFAGFRKGLEDDRGNLALKFVDIIESNDEKRILSSLPRTIVFWENVEGVLCDKTNAFGCLVSFLAGLNQPLCKKWAQAGVIHGPKRNVAWRVLDAKFFGVPQQRRRLYVLAGPTSFFPENTLFEDNGRNNIKFPKNSLRFNKNCHSFEVFREYTDCLYSAYGTKWNGNAAANNGSLFVVQDEKLRRLSPLETERLMGFPDDYTNIPKASNTKRYQATGNSWAVPVVKRIGEKLKNHLNDEHSILEGKLDTLLLIEKGHGFTMNLFDKTYISNKCSSLNVSAIPNVFTESNMRDIISYYPNNELFISPVGCYGILRRSEERKLALNERLKEVLKTISSQMSKDDIEKKSLIQKRGKHSIEKNK